MVVKVELEEKAKMPIKAHETDAGFDLFSTDNFSISPKGFAVIDTGVHIEIPEGYVGMLKSKSGLNVKHNLLSEGVIDSGYTGSIVVKLYNHGNYQYEIKAGDKITQLVILPIPSVELVEGEINTDTDRGNNGFGSSGR